MTAQTVDHLTCVGGGSTIIIPKGLSTALGGGLEATFGTMDVVLTKQPFIGSIKGRHHGRSGRHSEQIKMQFALPAVTVQ